MENLINLLNAKHIDFEKDEANNRICIQYTDAYISIAKNKDFIITEAYISFYDNYTGYEEWTESEVHFQTAQEVYNYLTHTPAEPSEQPDNTIIYF